MSDSPPRLRRGPTPVARGPEPGSPGLPSEHERAARVRAAIARLPKRQRATLILRVYHDLPHQQIAEIVGSSVGAVKANYFHALKKIQEYVRKETNS